MLSICCPCVTFVFLGVNDLVFSSLVFFNVISTVLWKQQKSTKKHTLEPSFVSLDEILFGLKVTIITNNSVSDWTLIYNILDLIIKQDLNKFLHLKFQCGLAKSSFFLMNSILIGKLNGNFTESYLGTFITFYNSFSVFQFKSNKKIMHSFFFICSFFGKKIFANHRSFKHDFPWYFI